MPFLGTAGDSPPPLATNATGVLGYVRVILDKLLSTLVQLGTTATGDEYTRITAGVDSGGIVRAAGVDLLGRMAVRDASDTFAAPSSHTRKDLTTGSTSMVTSDVNRRYIEIQNVHATDDIYFTLGAGVAALTLGDKLGPGMSWSGYYSGAINAICPAGAHTAMLSVKVW
jgi:hypothetical protein